MPAIAVGQSMKMVDGPAKSGPKKGAPKDAKKFTSFQRSKELLKVNSGDAVNLKNRQRILDNHPHFIQIRLERRGAGSGLAQTQ